MSGFPSLPYPIVDDETGELSVPYTFQFPILYLRSANGQLRRCTYVFDGIRLFSITGVNEPKISNLDVKLNSRGLALHQQAYVIARAKYLKSIDAKGYSFDPNRLPTRLMLANDYEGNVNFPVLVNPKYDGVRCRVTIENGKVVMYTRGGKIIQHLSHVYREIEPLAMQLKVDLDGELWNPLFSCQQIESIVGSKLQPHMYEGVLHYYIYDCIVGQTPYEYRYNGIVNTYNQVYKLPQHVINIAPTSLIKNETELRDLYDRFIAVGMEGVMIRHIGSTARSQSELQRSYYHGTRTNNLLKMKEVKSTEAVIVDVGENTGDAAGTPLFKLAYIQVNPPIYFDARCVGTIESQRAIFQSRQQWIGKTVTFEYNGMTDNNNSFRHPRVIGCRTML